jgi:hypothetical protein
MFAARGVAVSLSVFVITYCALSVGICLTWRALWLTCQRHPVRRIADMLFALRMFPLLAAALITVVFAVPSFLLLEPRTIDEPLGGIPLMLGICGAGLGFFGVIPRAVPALTAAGIIQPRVLMSGVAEFLLTGNELKTALKHEIEHVRRRDNLRKLLLRLVSFPGMRGLEAAWLEAIEMAADDAAVSSAGEALDLAAALIKLSRFGPAEAGADLTAALVHRPVSAMNARVTRLIAWTDDRLASHYTLSPWYGIGAVLAVVAVFAVTYSQLLVRVHTATEWLVR